MRVSIAKTTTPWLCIRTPVVPSPTRVECLACLRLQIATSPQRTKLPIRVAPSRLATRTHTDLASTRLVVVSMLQSGPRKASQSGSFQEVLSPVTYLLESQIQLVGVYQWQNLREHVIGMRKSSISRSSSISLFAEIGLVTHSRQIPHAAPRQTPVRPLCRTIPGHSQRATGPSTA